MTKTVWIRIYDAIDLHHKDIFRGKVPADFAEELTYDGACIWDQQGNLRHKGGLGAYIDPWHNVDWGMPYDNTVRFDDKLARFLIKYEHVNKVGNWRRNLPENFIV
ncbi:hypothetical protein [Brucella pituitosa]